MKDGRYVESEFIIPCLKIIKDNPNISTSEIKEKIKNGNYMILSDKDLELINNRTDEKFTQTLRNLLGSHIESNKFGELVNYTREIKNKHFTINQNGINYLIEHSFDDPEENIFIQNSDNFSDQSDLEAANNRTPILTATGSSSYQRDYRIAKTALKNSGYTCEYSLLASENHTTFLKQNNLKYVEAHHLFPLGNQHLFMPTNIDRIENIVSLCPNCHRAVHYANLNTKKKILKPLFDIRTPLLIQISKKFDYSFDSFISIFYS